MLGQKNIFDCTQLLFRLIGCKWDSNDLSVGLFIFNHDFLHIFDFGREGLFIIIGARSFTDLGLGVT
jgi:hypothetical protein